MAYSTSSPPALIAQGVASITGATGNVCKRWSYRNTDATTVVRVLNYITNAYALGIRKGDVIEYVKTDASPISVQEFIVTTCTSTTCDLSDGLAITATNTD